MGLLDGELITWSQVWVEKLVVTSKNNHDDIKEENPTLLEL
jgi:hypothetical protein